MRIVPLTILGSLALAATLFLAVVPQDEAAIAQTCGADYVMKEGESLADIAGKAYGNSSQWTLIFYANQDRMGANASVVSPGLSIRIPCLAGQAAAVPPSPQAPVVAAPADDMELSPTVKRLEFITADGFAPFTDRSLSNAGMFTQIVAKAMDIIKDRSGGDFSYNISWVNDWTAHLNPLLVTRAFDVGFPWSKPDCTRPTELSQDARYRCQRFFFSDPVYEVLTALFVKSNSPIAFLKDEEVVGKTICQAANQSTYELDKGGRNWVKENKIVLLRPQSVEECFKLLESGAANAVVAPDLTGKAAIASLGLGDKVKALPRPVAIGTLHLIVPKTHPHASTILYYLNSSIAKLRENGEYDKIAESHLSRFWSVAERR
jgi:polar amino acid transport system substrate-binding protein